MRLPITLSEIAPRISAGAFILNSGLGKRGADEAAAAGMHGFASGTYPFLARCRRSSSRRRCRRPRSARRALLTPFVPTAVAGAALTGFSGGLLGLYLKTPGMRKPGSLAPTQEGLAIAKDGWLFGIGLSIFMRGLIERNPRVSVKKAHKQAAKEAKLAAREARKAAKS